MEIDKEVFTEQVLSGYTIEELQAFWDCSRTKVVSHKKKWNLIGKSPNNKKRDNGDGTKTCGTCLQLKNINEFYSNGYSTKGIKKLKANCIDCESSLRHDRFYSNIKEALNSLGKEYKCEICGYSKNHASLTFHHFTTIKNKEISDMKTSSIAVLLEEIKLCKLLCQNCHHEIHHPHLEIKTS